MFFIKRSRKTTIDSCSIFECFNCFVDEVKGPILVLRSTNDIAHHVTWVVLTKTPVYDDMWKTRQSVVAFSVSLYATMYICKRDGKHEAVQRDKIYKRIHGLDGGLKVDAHHISKLVEDALFPGITTKALDNFSAEVAGGTALKHPDYGLLGGRLICARLQKECAKSFTKGIEEQYGAIDAQSQQHVPMISKTVYDFVQRHSERLDAAIKPENDFRFDYFGMKSMERGYLAAINKQTVETPQYMMMRVACGIHAYDDDIEGALESYQAYSEGLCTQASPTLFHSGTPKPTLSSCYLVQVGTPHPPPNDPLADRSADSIEGMYQTNKTLARLSAASGGIGLKLDHIRAKGSYIRGSRGYSDGTPAYLHIINEIMLHVNQAGKRNGSCSVYLSPWHADFELFLQMKDSSDPVDAKGKILQNMRARDLFYGIWIQDLFMKRVKANENWSFFCPDTCPELLDKWGDEFEKVYTECERKGLARRVVRAQTVWAWIMHAQKETGGPYMLYADSCNRKSNHKNLGSIKSSNLCTEILEFTDRDNVAVCNLASLVLWMFVRKAFDFDLLFNTTRMLVRNGNKTIDIMDKENAYPVPEARSSNMKTRPLGLGVQGLHDVFMMLGMPYDSPEAEKLNIDIFETIYYAALWESCELAKVHGPYAAYAGSPISQGLFQQDMWDKKPPLSNRWDWSLLRHKVAQWGVRNSLLVAPMPTASTSHLQGTVAESFEPVSTNLGSRRVLAGEFVVVNKHLIKALEELNLWDDNMRKLITVANGSVQNIATIPDTVKAVFKTAFEIKQLKLIKMAADRGVYIDQSQSFNLYIADPTPAKLTTCHFAGWEAGLKTGMYYLRSKAAIDAVKYGTESVDAENKFDFASIVAPKMDKKAEEKQEIVAVVSPPPPIVCSIDNKDCPTCSG